MKRLAVLDSTFTIRNRIKELAARADIEVIETSTPKQLLTLLGVPNDIGLIITELEFPNEDSFEVFRELKSCAGQTPVMILTGDNRRSSFVKGIRLGAADYVLKPFDGEFLFRRIVDLIGSEDVGRVALAGSTFNQEIPTMYVDFNSYVDKELKKAAKGKYPVSIMIAMIMDIEGGLTAATERQYQLISTQLHHQFSSVLFDTDVFMKYGSRSFIGVFPFCSPEFQPLIDEKLEAVFNDYMSENPQPGRVRLINNFSSYPLDGENREALMNTIEDRMAISIQQVVPGESENQEVNE